MSNSKPVVVEYYVSNQRMDPIRSHRWEANYSTGELLSVFREWVWNYPRESYTEDRHTLTLDITDAGTVEHDGRPLDEYAQARVNILTNKRGIDDPTIVRTERTVPDEVEE